MRAAQLNLDKVSRDLCDKALHVCFVLTPVQAQSSIGALCLMGNGGFAKDDKEALRWCIFVCSRAAFLRVDVCHQGTGWLLIKAMQIQCERWPNSHCSARDTEAFVNRQLSLLFNAHKSFHFYRYNVGYFYEKGIGCVEDVARAVRW